MKGINRATLVGNLGQDPDLRYTGSGTSVCNIRLATDQSYTNREGNRVEKTEWHNVVVWDRLAEICAEHLEKGSPIYVEGSLQTRSWKDESGHTRYRTSIKARVVRFLGAIGENS